MDRILQPFANGRLLPYWKRFTSPTRPLTDPDLYQEVRVLTSLLIVVFAIALVGAPTHLMQAEVVAGTHLPRLIAHCFNSLFIGISYVLTRSGRTTGALVLFIASWSVTVYVESWLLQGTDSYLQLYALILPVIAVSLFRSTRYALTLITIDLVAVLLLPVFSPTGTTTKVLTPALSLVLASLLFLAISHGGRQIQMAYRASIALREARYRELFNSVNDVVMIVSPNGDIQQVNRSAERVLGWTPDELVGHPFHEFLHPDDLANFLPGLVARVETMHNGKPSPLVEVRIRTQSGAFVWLEFNTTPHIDNGTVTMFTTTGRDISERKQAEAHRLKLAVEREKWDLLQKFVVSVSHDFRTSLSNIETNRYLIERALQPEQCDQLAPRMDVIRKQVTRLNEQLENLHFVTSLKTSHPVQVDMEQIASQVVSDLALVAVEKRVKIITQMEPKLSPVNGDGEYLYHAVRHLVSNAIIASKRGGQVKLALMQADDNVIVQTHNTGPEILAADLEHIFEPFYRVGNARSISQGGIGIGLTVVKMVAENYGGSVDVESDPELGTLFTLKLPAVTSAS